MLLQDLELTWLSEEMFWHQRSRVNWLNYGDLLQAFSCEQKKLISGLKNTRGEWLFDQSDIQRLVRDHFGAIFTTIGPRDFEEVINMLNLALDRRFSM